MFNARQFQARARNFEPRPTGETRTGTNVRRLRPNTIRLAVRPVSPRLVEGEGFAPETGVPPPPFDGILSLLELLERGDVPPRELS